MATLADARSRPVAAERLADSKSFNKYAFSRTLDGAERIAAVVSAFVPYRRSFDTVNTYYRTIDTLTPADIQAAAPRWCVDNSLIVTTLSKGTLPAGIDTLPSLDKIATATAAPVEAKPAIAPIAIAPTRRRAKIPLISQPSALPQLSIKLLFGIGSAHDPAGKEGLAELTAAMTSEAGSKMLSIDQIEAVMYPMAAGFGNQVDKELTTFTWSIHKDNWLKFLGIVLPQLLDPGFREDD